MVPSDANVTQDPVLTELIFRLPRLWIGYLIAILSFAAGVFELARNPGAYASSGEFPAIYLIGAAFGWFYWLFCVYRYHDVITDIPGYNHPIAASRAVAFHFIPFYNFYWVYRWPSAIAEFVNWRTQSKTMKGWVPGSFVLVAVLTVRIIDSSLGLLVLFTAGVYISRNLRRALLAPPVPASALVSPPEIQGTLGLK